MTLCEFTRPCATTGFPKEPWFEIEGKGLSRVPYPIDTTKIEHVSVDIVLGLAMHARGLCVDPADDRLTPGVFI